MISLLAAAYSVTVHLPDDGEPSPEVNDAAMTICFLMVCVILVVGVWLCRRPQTRIYGRILIGLIVVPTVLAAAMTAVRLLAR
ncbi:MAG: hypothetical protein QM755_02430 [Luteolibacter sp.]